MSNCIAAPRPLLQSRRATIKLNILAQINDKYPTHSFFSVVSPARDESSCTHAFQAHCTSDHKILSAWATLSPVAALPPQTGGFGEALLGFSKGTGSTDTAGSSRAEEQHILVTLPQNQPDTASALYPGKEMGQNGKNSPPCQPSSKRLAYKLQRVAIHTQWHSKT